MGDHKKSSHKNGDHKKSMGDHKKSSHKNGDHMEGDHKKGSCYNKKHCSPFKKRLEYSCLSHKALLSVARALNKIKGITIKYKLLSDKQLYDKVCHIIRHKFKCKTEACWLNIRKIMNNLSKNEADYFRKYFRPHMPKELIKDYSEWISNFDIEAVLNQYHADLDNFYSYGAIPIDFNKCSVSNLCKINIETHMDKGEHNIGIIFNTDESDEPGKHWISMYIDTMGKNLNNQPGIYFFDSFGSNPMKEIKELIKKLQDQGKKKNIEFIVANNDKSFQNNSFSCGFYCMHFMEHMIRGLPFNKYLGSGLNDKRMIEYQRHCYLHPDEIKY